MKMISDKIYIFISCTCFVAIIFFVLKGEGIIGDKAVKKKHPKTKLEFVKGPHQDFYKIKTGEKISLDYIIKNIGEVPLILYKIVPSCGCITYSASKGAAVAGDSIIVTLTFDSKGKYDFQFAQTGIAVNTEEQIYNLSFSGFVVADKTR